MKWLLQPPPPKSSHLVPPKAQYKSYKALLATKYHLDVWSKDLKQNLPPVYFCAAGQTVCLFIRLFIEKLSFEEAGTLKGPIFSTTGWCKERNTDIIKHSRAEWAGALHKRLRIISCTTGSVFHFICNDLILQATFLLLLSQQQWKILTNHLLIVRKTLLGINIKPLLLSWRLTLAIRFSVEYNALNLIACHWLCGLIPDLP